MGVTHKLKPEITAFIIEQKKTNPSLSCRKLSDLILLNFKAIVSKSSINVVIKESGLSSPVGRTPKKKKRIPMPSLPILLEDSFKEQKKEPLIEAEEEADLVDKEVLKAEEEAAEKLEEEKWKKAAEEDRKHKAQEEAAKKAEEERLAKEAQEKARLEEERKKKEEEEKSRLEAEKKAKEEEEKLRLAKIEAEIRLKEEALIKAEEEAAKLAEEEKRKAEEERSAQEAKKKAEEEAKRKSEEEAARIEEERRKAEVEAARRAEEERLAQEEAAKKAEEERLAKEAQEKARLEEERQKQEELERERLEAEKRAKEEERLKLEKLEEEKRIKEELIKAEEEAARADEEKRRLDQEAALKEVEEEKKRKEEAAKLAEEEKRKAEEERSAQEAKKKAEEEAKRKSEEDNKLTAVLNISRFPQIENSGIVILKAVESIFGASQQIASAISERIRKPGENFSNIVENLIYLPLLEERIDKPVLEKLNNYLNELDNVKVLNLDISRTIDFALQEVRCLKVILSDGSNLYLDGSFYSVWSSSHVPYDFALPVNSLKNYINKYFNKGEPLILFNAPGYDIPSQEFFNLLTGLEAKTSRITNVILYGNKLEELEVMPVNQFQKSPIIFGIWPWQFTGCRKVKGVGEPREYYLEVQGAKVFIADIEMELAHPGLNKLVTLSGCTVKTSLNEKTRLVILTNMPSGVKKSEELVSAYLNHWPNLEEAFQDYSRKIELFTYTTNSQRYFSVDKLNLETEHLSNVKGILHNYLVALDGFVRWQLLPAGYEERGLEATKGIFYNLGAQFSNTQESSIVRFDIPEEYFSTKDLAYLCKRINEKEIYLSKGLRLYFKVD